MTRPRTRPENKDPCSICGKVVKYKSDVARHFIQHAPNVEDLKTRCPWPNCNYKTLQKSNVSTHMIRSHGRKKIYFCSADPSCTFSALDQPTVDRHKRIHSIEDETLSPAVPELPRINIIPDVTEARTSSSSPAVSGEGFAFDPSYQHISQGGFANVDQDLWDINHIMQFASMPPSAPNAEPVSAPSYRLLSQEYCQPLSQESYQPLSWEDYYSINQCLAEMAHNGTVPSNAPNSQFASAIYQYGRQYAPRNNLASCSMPAWVQPSNNPALYNTYYQYEQQQTAPQQSPFLPGSNWEYIPESMPSLSGSSSSGASSLGDYSPDYGVPLEPFRQSLGDLPPDYGVPLEAFPPSSHPPSLDLNVPVQAAPVCQYDEPWDLGLQYYGNEMPGASNLDAQYLQLGSF